MQNINQNIANNIVRLRKLHNLTQIELSKELNISDKAVSKWERGESIPDIYMLQTIANFFKVDINYLINEQSNNDIKKTKQSVQLFVRNLLINILLCMAVYLVATFVFVFPILRDPENAKTMWVSFIIAIPICSLICSWYGKRNNYWLVQLISLSMFVWSSITAVYCIKIVQNSAELFWLCYLIGIPIEAALCIIFFWKKTF